MVIAILFEEPSEAPRMAEIIDRAQKMSRDVPDVKIMMTRGDAADTIKFFVQNGELPTDDLEESNWITHAKRELALAGNEEDFNDCVLAAIRAFAKYGHSGSSAGVGTHILKDLLEFKNLTPLTDDPSEWMQVNPSDDEVVVWQSTRNSDAFSEDGGKSYYLVSEGGRMGHPSKLYDTEKKAP